MISQSQQAVGYAYVGDDIDKGANNVISPIIWPDGHITYDKHYYILERQMPSPIKIHKTDEQDQGLKDVTFDLYRVNGEVETPIASGLTTNENGDLYVSQAESVAQSDLSTVTTSDAYDPQKGYIVQEDLAYLTPGNYRLKETTVPEGYKKTHFDFTVKAVQDMVADTSTPVPVQSFTFKNKSTYPVEYSFVSADNKKELPDEVKTLLPKDDELYVKGDIVNANEPETKSFKAKDGVWNFKAYDANSKQVNDENLKDGKIQFVGTWTFSPYAIALNQIPTIDAKDKTVSVGDVFDVMQDVTAEDVEDGDVTGNLRVLENNVPMDDNGKITKAGLFTITYQVTDSKGASSTKTITVTVNENTNNQPSKPEDGKNSSNDKGNSSTQKTERNSAKETKSSKGTKTSTGTYAAVFSGLASVSLAMLCGLIIVRKRQR